MRHRISVRLFLPTLRALLAASACLLWAFGPAFAQIEAPVRPRPTVATQAPGKTGFRAVSYEVFASLVPESQMLTARVIVEFQAQTASRTVECQLHPNLTIAGIRDSSGNSLSADRSGQDGLDVSISLPNVVPASQSIKLTFDYSGVLAKKTIAPSQVFASHPSQRMEPISYCPPAGSRSPIIRPTDLLASFTSKCRKTSPSLAPEQARLPRLPSPKRNPRHRQCHRRCLTTGLRMAVPLA